MEEFGRLLNDGKRLGLSDGAITKIETQMLVGYYPTYLLRELRQQPGDLAATKARFNARFGRRRLYRLWLAPILDLPRPLGIAWGMTATLLGRAVSGEFRRGVAFARN